MPEELEIRNLSSHTDPHTHAGSVFDNHVTLTFWKPLWIMYVSGLVLITQAIFDLEHAGERHTHMEIHIQSHRHNWSLYPCIGYGRHGQIFCGMHGGVSTGYHFLSHGFNNEQWTPIEHVTQSKLEWCQKGFGGFGVSTVISDCNHVEPFINLVVAITYSVGPKTTR